MGSGINGFRGLGKKAGFVGLGIRPVAGGRKLWFGGFIGSLVLRLGEDRWVGRRVGWSDLGRTVGWEEGSWPEMGVGFERVWGIGLRFEQRLRKHCGRRLGKLRG